MSNVIATSGDHDADADCHFTASTLAAIINFPLWRASSIAQSGFALQGSNPIMRYYYAMHPPYRGVVATIVGMSWARGAIFLGSDTGKYYLLERNVPFSLAQTIPPLVIGTIVQVVNMPLVRATITIQDPSSTIPTVRAALVHIYKTRGLSGLWHGVSAGILKTVPKYVTAVVVKDFMEENLPQVNPSDQTAKLQRSALNFVAIGVSASLLII